jgi:hypothetical protein
MDLATLAAANAYTRKTALGQGAVPVPGQPGKDGREVELRNDGSHLQWRHAGDAAWNDLADISALGADIQIITNQDIQNILNKF